MFKMKINGYEANYNNLFIYDGNEIVFQTCRMYDMNLRLDGLNIRNARKIDFSKNDCFTVKSQNNDLLWRNGKDLYIPASVISVKEKNEVLSLDTNGEKTFIYEYILEFHCKAETVTKHYEKVTDLPANMPLTDYDASGKWGSGFSWNYTMYDTYQNFKTKETHIAKHWLTLDAINEYKVRADYIHRSEKTEERAEREKIAELLSSCLYNNHHVSHYEVERIMEKFNISIK